MEEKNPKFLKLIIIAVSILAAFIVFYFVMQFFANKEPAPVPSTVPIPTATAPAATPVSEPEQTATPSPEQTPVSKPQEPSTPMLDHASAMDICQKAAIKHLGEGTMILPDNNGALTEVSFGGKTRDCYVFIGGSIQHFLSSASAEPPARYCVDVATGEVFDSISGKSIN